MGFWNEVKSNLNFNAATSGVRNTFKAAGGLLRNPLEEINGGFTELVELFVDIPDFGDFSASQRSTLLNKQANDAHIPVIYGERRVGGVRVFMETGGTDNQYLYIALVLCEGPVHSIGDIYIDDVLSTDSQFSGLVTIDKKTGESNQTASTTLTEATSWTSTHKLSGLAYLGIRLKYDANVFSGLPNIQAVVKGRKIYDPRKDSTSDGYDSLLGVSTHRENDVTTWEWTDNNVICLRDYLFDDNYGKGIPSSEIDDVSVKVAANLIDTSVTEYTGASGTTSLYNCNMVVDTSVQIFSNVAAMLKSFRGMLPYSNGVYKIIVDDDPASSTYTFDADNIVSGISVQSTSRKDRYNRVIANFVNKEKNYEPDEASYPETGSAEHTAFLVADNNFIQETTIDLPATTSVYQARDIAKIALEFSRSQNITVNFTADTSSIVCEVGDKVLLNYPDLNFSNKEFKVRAMTINNDSSCSFTLLEHDDTLYTWYEDDEVPLVTPPSIFVPKIEFIKNPITPSAGTLTVETETDVDGASKKYLLYTATASTYEFTDYYEINYRIGTSGEYSTVFQKSPRFILYGFTAGNTYQFYYRIIDKFGEASNPSPTSGLATSAINQPSYAGQRIVAGTLTGTQVQNDSLPFDKTEAFTAKTFGGTPSEPYYKGYIGPTGVGGGFENSDFAVGGKGYDNASYDTGGVVGYSENSVGVQAMTENVIQSGYSGWFGALTATGAYDYSESSYRSKAILANTNMGGFFTVGPELNESISSTDNTNPVRITMSSASGSQTNDIVQITGVTTMTQLNNNYYILSRVNSTTFDLYNYPAGTPVNGTSWSDGTGGNMQNILRPDFEKNVTGSNPHQASIEIARLNGTAYAYYINAGTTGPFTASHDGLIAKDIAQPEIGDIMVDIDMFAAPNVNDCITTMKLSSEANQVGVIGVCAGFSGPTFLPAALSESTVITKNEPSPPDTRQLKSEYADVPENYNFIAVNCIGEGKINVCGQAGNISVGDLIVASDTQGKGMKQSDDIIRSYTVAKSRENVTFASADEVKQIACIYLGG
jgi:hypothetical protein